MSAVLADSYLDKVLRDEGLSRDQLDIPCHQDHILALAPKISKWQSLAPYIGLNDLDEEVILASGKVDVQRRKMLQRWREKLGKKATYLHLARGMATIQRRDLIECLCDLVKSGVDPSAVEDQGVYNHG